MHQLLTPSTRCRSVVVVDHDEACPAQRRPPIISSASATPTRSSRRPSHELRTAPAGKPTDRDARAARPAPPHRHRAAPPRAGATPASAIAIIEDVTERARLERCGPTSSANISHELQDAGRRARPARRDARRRGRPRRRPPAGAEDVAESHRVARIIEDLLELSRSSRAAAAREVVAVGRWRPRPSSGCASSPTSAASTSWSLDDGAPGLTVLGDRRQLVSALANLLENAVKYSRRRARPSRSSACGRRRGVSSIVQRPRHRHPGRGPRPHLRALLPRRPGPQP